MIIVYQRVNEASVTVNGEVISSIGTGALILLGVEKGDTEEILRWGAKKAADVRAFEDGQRKMNRSLKEVEGSALVVSQFTLAGNTKKGKRPSFDKAAPTEVAEELYLFFCKELHDYGVPVQKGEFGAMMDVDLCNSGPVTLIIERRNEN